MGRWRTDLEDARRRLAEAVKEERRWSERKFRALMVIPVNAFSLDPNVPVQAATPPEAPHGAEA